MADMDRMYDLAFAYKKSKLWKKLWDSQLFAVQHRDGVIGYCSVTGMNGEFIALIEYPGEEGLQSYYNTLALNCDGDDSEMNIHVVEQNFAQHCILCSLQNKSDLDEEEIQAVRDYCARRGITLRGAKAWPRFEQVRPRQIPWPIQNEMDWDRLADALEAALEMAERLRNTTPEKLGMQYGTPYGRNIPLLVRTEDGFQWEEYPLPPEPLPPVYPEAAGLYDLTLKRATMKRKRTGTWACDIFLSPTPIQPEKSQNAPYFPWMQMVFDEDNDQILACDVCDLEQPYEQYFPNRLLELINEKGRPRRFLAASPRVQALYGDLAQKLKIPLGSADGCEGLQEAVTELFLGMQMGGENGGDVDALFEQFKDILAQCEDYSDFPDEVILLLSQAAETIHEDLPQEVLRRIQEEADKRFSK